MSSVQVHETFESIQGESSYAGLSCFFIRLSECNLRCNYCDTTGAYAPGESVSLHRLVQSAAASKCRIVEVTGGEPLLQEHAAALMADLLAVTGKPVLVETNGSRDLSVIPAAAIAIVDVKCPGSGAGGSFDEANLRRLRKHDEVKFVLSDRRDYEWAGAFVLEHDLAAEGRNLFFVPAWQRLDAQQLANWVVRDGLPVRVQIQLHNVLNIK